MSGPRILFVQHANPAAYPPVWRAATCLAAAGAAVRILGIASEDTLSLGDLEHAGLDVRVQRRGSSPLRRAAGDVVFLARAMAAMLSWRPHWVYVLDTRATPCGIIARTLGFPVVYHEHDIPVGEHSSLATRIGTRARRWVARRAQLRVAPNEARAAMLSEIAGGHAVQVVWNCPLREEVPPPRVPSRAPNGALRVVYVGSVSPARLPAALVDALARVRGDVTVDLRAYETIGSFGYLQQLRDRAEALGVASRLRILPPAPHREVMAGLGSYDLGLALLPLETADPNDSTMVGASNKVFEYLAAGVPILVTDRPEWREAFVESGVAFACNPGDPMSIAAALDAAAADATRRQAMGTNGRSRVLSEWNYETVYRPVVERLVVGRRQPVPSQPPLSTARAE